MPLCEQCNRTIRRGCSRAVTLAVLLLFGCSPVLAADPPVNPPVEPPAAAPAAPPAPPPAPGSATSQPHLNLPGINLLELTHGFFSRSLEGMADHVDAFFGDERIFEETSGTYFRLSGSAIYGRGGHLTFDTLARVRVDLTNLGQKMHLLVASDETLSDDETVTTGDQFLDRIDASNPVAALQFVLQEKKYWDVRLQPGIKIRAPIEPFVKLRMRRLRPLGEKWLFRATLVPAWYEAHGWRTNGSIDFDHAVGKHDLLRLSLGGLWQEGEKKNVVLRPAIFYAHQLTPVVAAAVEVGATFDTTPWLHDASYFGNIRLRRNLHQGWIFFEIKPQIIFERERDFRPDASLVLTLEMLFGEQYLTAPLGQRQAPFHLDDDAV